MSWFSNARIRRLARKVLGYRVIVRDLKAHLTVARHHADAHEAIAVRVQGEAEQIRGRLVAALARAEGAESERDEYKTKCGILTDRLRRQSDERIALAIEIEEARKAGAR